MSYASIASLDFTSMDVDQHGTAAVHFRPRRPLRFTAGQHALWTVPGGGAKPMSIASAPEEDVVTLGTGLTSRSRFKQALGALAEGSTVRFIGPVGGFTLPRRTPEVVMLAQGIGITPFRSMLRHIEITGADKRTTLVHTGAHHPFRADTEAAATAAHYPTSREEFAEHVTAVANQRPQAMFMVSGSRAFIASATTLLKAASVHPSQLMRDTFYGYSPTASLPTPPRNPSPSECHRS